MKKNIDNIEKKIINKIQSDFPVSKTPYKDIAEDLGISEEEVIQKIQKLKKEGIIRRIGGNFHPKTLGFVSTLCSASVPEEKLDFFVKLINSYEEVTHNYLRENHFNVWFTIISTSEEEIEKKIEEIEKKTQTKINNLPSLKTFKISAKFKL